MAITGSSSVTLKSSNGYSYTLSSYFSENSTSTANNTSTVYVEAKLKSTNANWTSSYNSNLKIYWYDNNSNSGGKQVASVDAKTIAIGGTITASGNVTVTHKSDGTLSGYVKAVWTKGGNSAYTPASGSTQTSSKALTNIPRQANITEAPDFTDEENPTIKYSNPAGTAVTTLEACIASTDGKTIYAPYRSIGKSGSSYTFELTDTERTNLRVASASANVFPLKFYVKTVIGSTTLTSSVQKNLTVINATPTLSSVTAVDINPTTTALTGSSSTVVKGYSNVKVSNVVAEAFKSATLQNIVVDDISETYVSGYTKTINGYTKNNLSVGVVDSRSNTSAILTKTFTFVDYEPIAKGNMSATRASSGVGEAVTVVLDGTWYNGSFGSVNNALTASYRFKETSATTWTTGQTALTFTTSGNRFSLNKAIRGDISAGFDVDKSFNLEITFTDKLSTVTFSTIISSGTPAIAVQGNRIALGGKFESGDNEDIQFRKLVNSKYIKYGTEDLASFLANLESFLANVLPIEVIGSGNNVCYKFKDVFQICVQKYSGTTNCTSGWGSVYTGVLATPVNYAHAFASEPAIVVGQDTGNANYWLSTRSEGGVSSTTKPVAYQAVRPTSSSGVQYKYTVIAIGVPAK